MQQRLLSWLLPIALVSVVSPARASFLDDLSLSTTASSTTGIDPVDPLLVNGLSLSAGYKLGSSLALGTGLGISQQLTGTDTAYDREVLLSDTAVTLSSGGLWKLGMVSVSPSMGFYLPTSKSSSYTRRMGLRFGASGRAAFGPVSASLSGTIHKNFPGSTTAGYVVGDTSGRSVSFTPGSVAGSSIDLEDAFSTRRETDWFHSWTTGLSVSPTSKLSISFGYTLVAGYAFNLPAAPTLSSLGVVGTPAGAKVESAGESFSLERFSQSASLAISHPLGESLNLSGSIANSMGQRRPNGKDFYNPFLLYWKGTNHTTVTVALSYSL